VNKPWIGKSINTSARNTKLLGFANLKGLVFNQSITGRKLKKAGTWMRTGKPHEKRKIEVPWNFVRIGKCSIKASQKV